MKNRHKKDMVMDSYKDADQLNKKKKSAPVKKKPRKKGKEKEEEETIPSLAQCSTLALQCQSNYDSKRYKPTYTPTGGYMYEDPRCFNLQEWDPCDLPEGKCVSLIWVGKRRTGKSFGERWYMDKRKEDIKEVYVFTRSKANGWYQKFLPDCFIFPGWFPQICNNIMERGETMIKKGVDPQDVGIMIIGDDLISDHGMRYHEEFDKLYTMGRHCGIEAHWMTQKYKAIPNQVRINADIVIIFTIVNGVEKKGFIEEYLSTMNKQTASELIDIYTDPNLHTALVLELWRNSHDPEEYIKVMCATDPNLRPGDIGSAEYWEEGQKDVGKDIDSPANYLGNMNYKKMAYEASSLF